MNTFCICRDRRLILIDHDVLSINLIVEDVFSENPDFKPAGRKPEGTCFWCRGPLEPELEAEYTAGFGRYYARCRRCREEFKPDSVLFVQCGTVPVRIDQPMYWETYPNEHCIRIPRFLAEAFVSMITEDELELEEGTLEVLLSPAAYYALEELVYRIMAQRFGLL